MDITRQNLKDFFRGMNIKFAGALEAAAPMWRSMGLFEEVQSMTATEDYAWLGAISGLQKFTGEVEVQNLHAHSYQVPNEDYASVIGVKRTDLEDDKFGIYSRLAVGHGAACSKSFDDRAAKVLFDGFTSAGKCYTGSSFFNATHTPLAGKPSFSNLMTAKFSENSFTTARRTLRERKNVHGQNMGLGKKLVLLVGPKNQTAAEKVLNAQDISGTTNVLKGAARLEIMNEISVHNEDAWFVYDESMIFKPMFVQMRQAPTPSSTTDPDDSHVLTKEEFLFKIGARFNVAYGMPEYIIGSDGSTSAL